MIPEIRPALEMDRATTDGVLEAVWGEDQAARGYFEPKLEPNPSKHVLVASLEDRVVGFASVRGNGWHPTRDYVGVNVHPAFQAQGIDAALFTSLENILKARGKPSQTATMETQVRARRFLERRGFTEIMRTYTPTFDPRTINLESFQSASKRLEKLNLEVRSLAELGRSKELDARLARLHHTIYRDTHTWNPTADMTLEISLETFMGEDVIPEAMFVALLNGEPIGVSSLRGDLNEPELAWFGIVPSHKILGPDATLALVGRCLEYASAQGAPSITGEFDSLNPLAVLVLKTLQIEPGEAWITLQCNS
jgi:GNAT superfamily N-acetyltransferase